MHVESLRFLFVSIPCLCTSVMIMNDLPPEISSLPPRQIITLNLHVASNVV